MCANIVTECAKPVTQRTFLFPGFQRIVMIIGQNAIDLIAARILLNGRLMVTVTVRPSMQIL